MIFPAFPIPADWFWRQVMTLGPASDGLSSRLAEAAEWRRTRCQVDSSTREKQLTEEERLLLSKLLLLLLLPEREPCGRPDAGQEESCKKEEGEND